MKIQIKKGNHYSDNYSIFQIPIPRLSKNNIKKYNFVIWPNDMLGIKPQDSWNKLWGYSSKLNPRKNSIRIAWRFDVHSGLTEYTIFREVNKSFTWGEILKGVKADVKFDLSSKILELRVGNNKTSYYFDDTNKYDLELIETKCLWECHPYFGGNKPADTDYLILKNQY